jgi:hypothetical protein
MKQKQLVADLMKRHQGIEWQNYFVMPLEYWLAILNDPLEPQSRRDKAAQIALPYTAVQLKYEVDKQADNQITVVFQDFSRDTQARVISTVSTPVIGTTAAAIEHQPAELPEPDSDD